MELIPSLSTAILVGTLSVVLMGVFWLWSLVWAYRDAERRGRSGPLVALLVAVAACPLGLIVWLVARPPEQM